MLFRLPFVRQFARPRLAVVLMANLHFLRGGRRGTTARHSFIRGSSFPSSLSSKAHYAIHALSDDEKLSPFACFFAP